MQSEKVRNGIVIGAALTLALVVVTLLGLCVAGHIWKLESPPMPLLDLLKYVLGSLVVIVLGNARAIPKSVPKNSGTWVKAAKTARSSVTR